MAISTARLSNTLDDAELATLAIAGDGDAFARLYDRHERRVFGFCLRMLGTEDEAADATQETFMRLLRRLPALHERELNFAAYALAAARNACYDAIDARRRVEPVAEQLEPSAPEPGDVTLDPERAALLSAAREDVRRANAALPTRHREVLALREVEQLSYEQIGKLVGLNSNAVAQLISRARIKLRDLIQGGALESIAVATPECARALPLLARVQDAERQGVEDVEWLRTHLARCERCRLSRAAMEEAGVSYRALGPIVPLVWLRHTTIARAAELVGADWSSVAPRAPATRSAARRAAKQEGLGPERSRSTRSSAWTLGRSSLLGLRRLLERRSLRWLLAVLVICVAVAILLVGNITPDARVLPQAVTPASSAATIAPVAGRPLDRAHRLAHRARLRVGKPQARTGPAPASAVPVVLARPMPATLILHRGGQRVRKRRSTHAPRVPLPKPAATPPPPPAATTPTSTALPTSPPTTSSAPPSSGSAPPPANETPPPKETPGPPPGGPPGPRGPLGG